MPYPAIGEIVQEILRNDSLLNALERKGWFIDIDTKNEEEVSVLRSPSEQLNIRQWHFPHLFMQYVIYEKEIVYHTRGTHGNSPFEHPEIYVAGSWEDKVKKLYQFFSR